VNCPSFLGESVHPKSPLKGQLSGFGLPPTAVTKNSNKKKQKKHSYTTIVLFGPWSFYCFWKKYAWKHNPFSFKAWRPFNITKAWKWATFRPPDLLTLLFRVTMFLSIANSQQSQIPTKQDWSDHLTCAVKVTDSKRSLPIGPVTRPHVQKKWLLRVGSTWVTWIVPSVSVAGVSWGTGGGWTIRTQNTSLIFLTVQWLKEGRVETFRIWIAGLVVFL